jgi:hypothetical protein
MPLTRRDILGSMATAGTLHASGLLGTALESASLYASTIGTQSQSTTGDTSTYDFWSQDIRNPNMGATRGIASGNAPRATCVYFDKSHGFVTGSDMGDTGLADKGDVNVIVNVDHIRPSIQDQSRLVNLEAGSLRIDLQQANPTPSLPERLAWTAIAGLLPDNKKLPPLKELTFDTGTAWGKLQSVPLPGGGGLWTWNFFLQHRKSRWMELLEGIRNNQGLLLPIFGLGLPAMAITALTTIDRVVAGLTKGSGTEWLFQSSDSYIYATKEARDSFEGSKMRLRQGTYIIMPTEHLSTLAKQQSQLIVKDGLIVPANTSSLEVYDAAKAAIPDVTYISVGVTTKLRLQAKA